MDIDQEGKNNPSKGDNNYNNINSGNIFFILIFI